MERIAWVAGIAAFVLLSAVAAQDRETRVRGDKQKVETSGFWIYNDLPKGLEQARLSGKPLLVTFRCIPCEHCAQLDEQVAERDPAIRKLLDQFVCVRIVHANGMDLNYFQFDYDQSWTAFFLNADRTLYGRYGTRSHRTETENDMSLAGFARALEGALELHHQYPKNKTALAGKRGAPVDVAVPEEYPWLKGKYGSKLDYEGKVVQSCIHCHQVGESKRLVYRKAGKPIPDAVLYPYPHPRVVGLVVDAATKATLKAVPSGSPAAQSGFKPGDEIALLEGQPILSIADLQWVLNQAGPTAALKAAVRRGGALVPVTLTLPEGWRQKEDISWRATSWDLRRMVTGGMVLEPLPEAERQTAGVTGNTLALRVKHVGQYGEHAAAKRAGFQPGDVLISVDGKSAPMTESELLVYLAKTRPAGEKVPVTLLRKGAKLDLMLPMQ